MDLQLMAVIVLSFIISIIICPIYIRYTRRLQFSQHVREDGPSRHMSKTGTPTMGGVVFLLASLIALIITEPRMGLFIFLCLLVTLGNGLIGFLDDYGKVLRGASLGLKARSKLAGQILITAVLMFFLYRAGHPTDIDIPFTGISFETGYFYPILLFLMILGTTNAVNLTDGLDGLAGGASIIALTAFLIIASMQGLTEIVLFCGALVGACFGFLLYNLHPARLFMGDVGSLALGGALAVVAVLTKTELLLIIIGAVYVVEALSVIIQVISFRFTGKRIFLMSPLHHHFELKGWTEWKVVMVFWSVSFLFAVIGITAAGG